MGFWGSAWGGLKGFGQALGGGTAMTVVHPSTKGQKSAIADAQTGLSNLGVSTSAEYDRRGQVAIDRFQRAGGAYQDFQTQQPSYVQDFAKNYQGAPTQVRDWYGQYQPTNTLGNRYQQVQSQGYGADPLAERYRSSGAVNPSQLKQNLGQLQGYAGGYGASSRLGSSLAAGYATPDALDQRVGELRTLGGIPSQTSTALANLQLMDPARRTDYTLRGLQGIDPGFYSGEFSGKVEAGGTAGGRALSDFERGNTASGRLLNDLQQGGGDTAQLLGEMRGGSSPTASLQRTIAQGGGDSGRFLGGFDANRQGALHDTYGKLAAEGPTYEEDFYTSQMTGENPAFKQLKQDFIREQQGSAAARGGFTSGQALDMERRGLSRLAADEFARRGELAASAGSARRERLGQQLSGAGALEQNILGREGLAAEVGLGRDRMQTDLATTREGHMTDLSGQREGRLADLSTFGDATRAGLAGDQDRMLAGLATSRDELGGQHRALEAGLAQFGDSQTLSLGQLGLQGAGQSDQVDLARQGMVNDLIGQGVQRDVSRGNTLAGLAGQTDLDQRARQDLLYGTMGQTDSQDAQERARVDSLAGAYSQDVLGRGQAQDRLAGASSDEYRAGQSLGLQGAQGASGEQAAGDQFGLDTASAASGERLDNLRTQFDQALQLGNAESAIQKAYDMAAMGALTESQLAQIDLLLQSSGLDAAARQQFLNNLMSIGGLAAKASSGGAGG